MKAIEMCKVCGGKVIQIGIGNIFCEDCSDRDFGNKLQKLADMNEKKKLNRSIK